MSNEYLRAFVIGSCFFTFFPYFYEVSHLDPKKINYNYNSYTYVAPIGLGLMNVFSLILAKTFHLSREQRYLAVSLLAPTIVIFFAILLKFYNYTQADWFQYIIVLYSLYFITFNFTMPLLDKYV